MRNGLTMVTGPRHRTEDSHGAVHRPRRAMKETAISIRQDGQTIWRGKCPSDPQLLAAVIRKRAPQARRVVFETGPLAVWLPCADNRRPAGHLQWCTPCQRSARDDGEQDGRERRHGPAHLA